VEKEIVVEIGDIEELVNSAGWKAVCGVLLQRLTILRNELELKQFENISDVVGRQEACATIRYVLELPKIMLQEMEAHIEKEGAPNV